MALGFYLGPAAPPPREARQLKPIQRSSRTRRRCPTDLLALLHFAAEHYRHPLGEVIRGALPPGPRQGRGGAGGAARTCSTSPWRSSPRRPPRAAPRARAVRRARRTCSPWAAARRVDELAPRHPRRAGDAAASWRSGAACRIEERAARSPRVREGLGAGPPRRSSPPRRPRRCGSCRPRSTPAASSPSSSTASPAAARPRCTCARWSTRSRGARAALVLVPEIALTPQLVGRFRSRFGARRWRCCTAGLKDRERLLHWQAPAHGHGAHRGGRALARCSPRWRTSALIVVDEEHDPSFKQEEKLRYQARDLAVVRAKQAGATVVLGSATPSLETLENARRGRYRHLRAAGTAWTTGRCPGRAGGPAPGAPARRPACRRSRPSLSPPLLDAMGETLGRGPAGHPLPQPPRPHAVPALRGVRPGRRAAADCDVSPHLPPREPRKLQCHYCGESQPGARALPASAAGRCSQLGVGTERVEAEVAERFPSARVARLDRDAATSAERLTELLAALRPRGRSTCWWARRWWPRATTSPA